MPGSQPRSGLFANPAVQSCTSISAPNTQPLTAPTAASTATDRQPGKRSEPETSGAARPAATPTHPVAKTWYGSHGPTPPSASAETRIENAPTRKPYDGPNTQPAHSTRKKM